MREALRAAFPWPVQRKGFMPPAPEVRGEIDAERERLLSAGGLERGGVFRPDVLAALGAGTLARPTRVLWSMLVIQAWIHTYLWPLVDDGS